MSLKAITDAVPDGLADYYTAREDGKFVLSVESVDGYALEDVTALKNTLGKERTERKEYQRKLTAFGDLDPDAAQTAIARAAELESFDPKAEADKLASERFEAASKDLGKKHTAELAKREDRIKALSDTVDKIVRRQQAAEQLASAKGSVELLMPHILAHTRTVETDGRYDVEIVDDYGNIKTSNSGANMSLAEYVAELKSNEAYGRAFDASSNKGSGKEQRKSGGAGLKRGTMSADEKLAYQTEHGQEAYLKLPH